MMRLAARTLLVLPANTALAAVFFLGALPVALGRKDEAIVAIGVLQLALAATLAICSILYFVRPGSLLRLAILIVSAVFLIELAYGDFEQYSLTTREAWNRIVPLSPIAAAIWVLSYFVLKKDNLPTRR